MAEGSFTQWRYEQPYGTEGAGTVRSGSGTPEPFFRSRRDQDLAMYNAIPGADHPDGYLGTIHSRRGDRMLDRLKARQNQKNYQRGVHKGERIDQSDYFWPKPFDPRSGLQRQAATLHENDEGEPAVLRFTPPLRDERLTLAHEGKTLPYGAEGVLSLRDPKRASQLAHLRPKWR